MREKGSETIPEGSTSVSNDMMEMVALFKFYVLKDPVDNLIKYVGRTVDEKNRFRNHIYESKKRNRTKKERWIVSLLRKNLSPVMQVIYQVNCSLHEAISIEKMLVKKIGKRFVLKNEPDNYLGAIHTGTPVYQYDTNGEFVKMYSNSNQAYIDTGIKDCNIARCCKNENGYGAKTAGGFFWSYIKYKKYPHKYVTNWRTVHTGKAVLQFDTLGNFIKEYATGREAHRFTGINYKHISACVTGKRKVAGGYVWKLK